MSRWREVLFTTPGLSQYVSGVIVFDETLRSAALDGTLLRDKLKSAGMILGVKVDAGTTGFPGSCGESATLGLDNLAQRCKEYYSLGCRFAKWRAVHKIGAATPTEACVLENARTLARYGARPPSGGGAPYAPPKPRRRRASKAPLPRRGLLTPFPACGRGTRVRHAAKGDASATTRRRNRQQGGEMGRIKGTQWAATRRRNGRDRPAR